MASSWYWSDNELHSAQINLMGKQLFCSIPNGKMACLLWREKKGMARARRRSRSMTTPSRRLPTTLRGMKVYSDSPSRADAGSFSVATCATVNNGSSDFTVVHV